MKGRTYADQQDARLAAYRRLFAQRFLEWLDHNGITSYALERLSEAASGRRRINSSQVSKLRKVLADNDPAFPWHPQGSWFVAMSDLNALVVAVRRGTPPPPDVDADLCRAIQPMRNDAGDPATLDDLIRAFYGLTEASERTEAPGPDPQLLPALIRQAVDAAIADWQRG